MTKKFSEYLNESLNEKDMSSFQNLDSINLNNLKVKDLGKKGFNIEDNGNIVATWTMFHDKYSPSFVLKNEKGEDDKKVAYGDNIKIEDIVSKFKNAIKKGYQYIKILK